MHVRLRPARWAAAAAATLALSAPAAAAVPPGFTDSLVASVGAPTALAFTPDGRMLVTTQPGRLRIVAASGALVVAPALDLSARICANGERGLLGVAVDPAFALNRFVYLFYTASDSGCVNRVSRFTLSDANLVDPASELVLLDRIPSPAGNHNGGDLAFGKDGYLYVSVGDGGCDYAGDSGCAGANDAARDRHVLLGKILRITADGAVPSTNPFQGAGTARCNVTGRTTAGSTCQETFAWGLRNPFRFAFDPNAAGTRFFINDVGQNHWEEIDVGQAGADYGWNVREGPCALSSYDACGPPPAGMTNPIHAYPRTSGCSSITGGAFVPAGVWPDEYNGTYLFADFVCGKIFRLTPSGAGHAVGEFATGLGSVVAMTFGPAGTTRALYYTTYAGEVRRIAYTGNANRAPTAVLATTPACACGPAPLTVTFDARASSDPDGDPLLHEWDLDGDGAFGDASGATPSRRFDAGTYVARLRVSDGRGGANVASVTVTAGNTAPEAAILAPADGGRFLVGEAIVLSGSATDAQDGALPASSLSWRVTRHHGTSHAHPWLPWTAGNGLAVEAPAPEDLATTRTSHLEIELTATDSHGVSTTVRRILRPSIVDLTFATVPAGLPLALHGETMATPFVVGSWEGWRLRVSAPWQVDGRGRPWAFASWSDGGAREHDVVTLAAPGAYTARFSPAVRIAAVRYDPPGDDRAVLNREWVRLRNFGERAVALTGWTLRDGDGNVLRFGRYTLPAGGSVTVHTGRGRNGQAHRYWRRARPVWDDRRETAVLRVRSGALAHACSYRKTRAGAKRC